MRLFIIGALVLALVAPHALAVEFEERGKTSWIVGFHEMPDLEPGDLYQGAEVISVTPNLRFVTVEALDFATFEVRAKLDENVRYVETDVSDHSLLFTPNDYFWTHASNWGVKKIGAETAWDSTLGSTSIKDGHLDSGIVRDHEDFTPASRFLAGWDYYQGDSDPQDESGCNWHGSHTTGTVAATINNAKGFAGMAQITVIPVKIFGGALCWAASTTNMANALAYVGDQGAHLSSNSWGGGSFSSAINDAITYSTNKGVIFVASSGNGGCNNCVGNPWVQQASNTIIVTATDSNDNGASFNSKGPQVDVSAPGVGVGSAGGPGSSYYVMDGTSMAAPHVAGLVGLIKTVNPSWDRAQVTNQITSTAVDLGPAGHDDTFGWGRIDAAAAVGGGGPPANVPPTASFTFSCTDLACSFDGTGSSDSDGSVVSYSWTFGDGNTATGATPGHSYASAGTYTVTLTVTDNEGATGADSQSVSVTAPGGGGITLSASGYKVKGKHTADLTWSGASGGSVDVWRDGSIVATTANDGAYTDNIGAKGGGVTYSYQVCEAGTSTCSNTANVVF